MQYLLFLWFILFPFSGFSQNSFPDFLHGTWKTENKLQFEHWDLLNETTLKGISYELRGGNIYIIEYLDLQHQNQDLVYTATVVRQNQGKEVAFIRNPKAVDYSFENLSHDFPKKIIYQRLGDSEIMVTVTDGMKKTFSYKMFKQ